MNYSYLSFKRACDFILATLLLIFLLPFLTLLTLLLYLSHGRPIFFRQSRAGFQQKVFTLYKFRSMDLYNPQNPLGDSKRTTILGSFLRASSLDELPSLINILKGDLSFVGPRPLLCEYLHLYTPEQNLRHSVRPGLTGLAQVNGRNSISWEEKFSYDALYVRSISFPLDFFILIKTFYTVLFASGVNHHGSPMPPFTGGITPLPRT